MRAVFLHHEDVLCSRFGTYGILSYAFYKYNPQFRAQCHKMLQKQTFTQAAAGTFLV